jgi:hypothetical protein
MTVDGIAEVLTAANNKSLAETGGSHNQKGVDFQRNWALIRIFQLDDEEDDSDFVVLFETVQDIAILDSKNDSNKDCHLSGQEEGSQRVVLAGID